MVNKLADPQWTSGMLLQYQSGVDKEGSLYKGIIAFMVVRLKQSTPFVAQAIPQTSQANPEVTFNGQWLAEKISDNIDNLIETAHTFRCSSHSTDKPSQPRSHV